MRVDTVPELYVSGRMMSGWSAPGCARALADGRLVLSMAARVKFKSTARRTGIANK
jgi:hypothetical protein